MAEDIIFQRIKQRLVFQAIQSSTVTRKVCLRIVVALCFHLNRVQFQNVQFRKDSSSIDPALGQRVDNG